MGYGFKAIQHRAAYAVGGAFRQPEMRMIGFQGFQLAVEPVVFGIGHAGRVQSVVFVGVAVERLHEGADALLGVGHGAGCLKMKERYFMGFLVHKKEKQMRRHLLGIRRETIAKRVGHKCPTLRNQCCTHLLYIICIG